MSSNTEADGRSVTELRRMDEQTARQTLTVAEYERWEAINDLHDQADETRQQWAEEDERVSDIVVHADRTDLGTAVDLYGNDVLVHVDPEDDAVRDAADTLDGEFGDVGAEDAADLDDVDVDRLAGLLCDLFDAILLEFNGTAWDDLDDDTRRDVLADAREKWGVEGLLLAWADVAVAVEEDRNERLDVIESFRSPERRGRR